MPNAPEIERVQWRSASAGELWVEVHGRWPGRPRDLTPALVIGEGAQPAVFPALHVRWGVEAEASAQPEGSASGAVDRDRFRARFSVPVALRRQLGERLALRFGEHELGLPRAQAVALPRGPASPPNVIDPAVLAERRARRAELGEETLARRAAQAESQVHDLEAQLDQLEHQLQDALAERERTARELAGRERELRVLRQREYSEEQLRVEAEEARKRLERQAKLELNGSRERLATAERRVAELEAELERAHRQAAEAEHSVAGPLLAELRRRQEVHDHVRAELESMREELSRLRAGAERDSRRRMQAEARVAELEQAVASLRDQIEVRQRALTEAEQIVADLRRQSGDLARTLEEERREHLNAERELRTELEAQAAAVRATTAELRSELERVSRELGERERREADLMELLADFVRTATALRETFEREMTEARAELEQRVAAERDSYTRALSELEARVEGLRPHLEEAAALSEELEMRTRSETQVRQALAEAHEELRRLEHDEARHREELEHLRRELARLRAEQAGAAAAPPVTPAPPVAPTPQDVPFREDAASHPVPPSAAGAPRHPARVPGEAQMREQPRLLAADLTEAFRRLRERAAEGHREVPEAPPAGPWMPRTHAGPAPPQPRERPQPPAPAPTPPQAAPSGSPTASAEARTVPERIVAPTPEHRTAAPAPEPPARDAPPAPAEPIEASPAPIRRVDVPWLTSAIVGLAEGGDRSGAARLLADLLPVQGALVKRNLTYLIELEDVEPAEGALLRVTIAEGRASVRKLSPEGARESAEDEADFKLTGSVADLASLVGGSAPRRLPRVRVSGGRRRLRHLLRRLRRPVTLPDLARGSADPDPGQLLGALVQGVDPAWVDGHEFAVVYAIERSGDGDDERRFHVEVRPEQPVRVIEGGPDRGGELEVSAALRVPPGALVTLLAGLPLATGQRAEVEGDGGKIVLLGEWFERVQGRT